MLSYMIFRAKLWSHRVFSRIMIPTVTLEMTKFIDISELFLTQMHKIPQKNFAPSARDFFLLALTSFFSLRRWQVFGDFGKSSRSRMQNEFSDMWPLTRPVGNSDVKTWQKALEIAQKHILNVILIEKNRKIVRRWRKVIKINNLMNFNHIFEFPQKVIQYAHLSRPPLKSTF